MNFIRLLALALISSCSTTPLLPPGSAEDYPALGPARPLVLPGRNSQPSFSPSGDVLVFVSSHRYQHLNPQIYIWDFKSKSEKRISYQDGHLEWPRFVGQQNIVYSSSTDEEKESTWRERQITNPSEATEIYIRNLSSGEIERLTQHEGPDSLPVPDNLGRILFLRGPAGKRSILSIRHPTGNSKLMEVQPAGDITGLAAVGTKILWSESSSGKKYALYLKTGQRKKELLFELSEPIIDLSSVYANELVVFSSGGKIHFYDIANKCGGILAQFPEVSLRHPALRKGSPSLLVFAIDVDRFPRLYSLEIPESQLKESCKPLEQM